MANNPYTELGTELARMLERDERLSKTPPNSIAQIGTCACGGQIELEIKFKNPTASEPNFVGGVFMVGGVFNDNDDKFRPANFVVDIDRCFCNRCGVCYDAETVCAR